MHLLLQVPLILHELGVADVLLLGELQRRTFVVSRARAWVSPVPLIVGVSLRGEQRLLAGRRDVLPLGRAWSLRLGGFHLGHSSRRGQSKGLRRRCRGVVVVMARRRGGVPLRGTVAVRGLEQGGHSFRVHFVAAHHIWLNFQFGLSLRMVMTLMRLLLVVVLTSIVIRLDHRRGRSLR